jgi:hypothetical protein
MEDNEEIILESESSGLSFDELTRLPLATLDRLVPEHRSHPIHCTSFVRRAAGFTALMDRLLEFKPANIPGLVFWPGFDEEFRDPVSSEVAVRQRFQLEPAVDILIYNGNVHDTNSAEVRSLFLAVQALARAGRPVKLVKTGLNHVQDYSWIQEGVDSGAVLDLGFIPRSELPALLSAATVLVQPGRSGRFNVYRFPSKLPEFFVSGKPVVLPNTNVGRFLRDGVDALLLHEGHAIEIADKIDLLLNDAALAASIGQNGREFALRNLVWEKNVPPIKALYERVVAAQSSAEAPGIAAAESPPSGAAVASPPAKLIAFYLPQFHPIRENDEHWGKGFTEWTSVTRAKPNFGGHYQPQLPADLGFYDLRLPEILHQQADLARSYGIFGFCFYYYWFSGRRVLDRPLTQMLQSGQPDFPFCICWANENWTRNWDGSKDELLIAQDYSGDTCERFIREVIPILKDARYIRVKGAPMLLVYRINDIPDPLRTAQRWRSICAEEGIREIHLCAVQSFGIDDPHAYGFDAAVEFPPHTKRALLDPAFFPEVYTQFEGYLEDYPTIVQNQLAKPMPNYAWYRGVMPAWDNTPRRGTRAHILVDSSPEQYERWLATLVAQARDRVAIQEPFIFINAWNEWAEGAYLEPDQHYGHARLSATLRALTSRRGASPIAARAAAGSHALQATAPSVAQEVISRPTDHARPAPKPKAAPELQELIRRYQNYSLEPLSYATVRDYCDSFDHLHRLATANGDLKDCQRPWILKAILAEAPPPGRVLEIGAGEPLVADLLSRMGYDAWIVDPYDGSGNGPTQFEEFRKRYPHLSFVRSQFHDHLPKVPERAFDCIYSISVLEHVPPAGLQDVFSGLKRYLTPTGSSIHAVDHVSRGNGAPEHLVNLKFMCEGFGFDPLCLDALLARMSEDTETYYLSAESHNRWRAGVPYDDFPMRACVSIQFVAKASRIRSVTPRR